jgi:succinate-acetate transporter protein
MKRNSWYADCVYLFYNRLPRTRLELLVIPWCVFWALITFPFRVLIIVLDDWLSDPIIQFLAGVCIYIIEWFLFALILLFCDVPEKTVIHASFLLCFITFLIFTTIYIFRQCQITFSKSIIFATIKNFFTKPINWK